MKSLADTFMGRVLGWLADLVTRHRWFFFWPQFVLLAVCVVYTIYHFDFDPNQDNLVGSDKKYHQIFLQYEKEFPAQDDLVVVVQSDDAEKNRQFVERLGRRLEAETNIFTDVFYKGDLKMMGRKALLFVPEDDLQAMRDTLKDFLPFIQQFTAATNLESLFNLVNSMVYHAKAEANAQNNALMQAIPMLTRIADQATASLSRPGSPPSPGIYALFGAGEEAEQDIYITYAKGTIFLCTARAKSDELNFPAVDRLRELVALTSQEVPGLNVGLTGEPVLDRDQMAQSERDCALATVVSLVICALIFILGYQETGRPLKATLCLIVGLGYSMAFAMLTVGHLNILTVTFFPIIIGLAIDFGVHLITRYEEELRHGKSQVAAMRTAMVFTGQGILTGAMTTAAAFIAMWLTNFKGIQEMGIICGGGMMICFFPMMTLLPVMLFHGRQNVLDQPPDISKNPPQMESPWRARIESIWLKRPKTVVVVTLILTALATTQFHKVYFDYDLLDLQSAGLQSVVYAKKLIKSTSQSILFGAVLADTPEKAVELVAKLDKLPAVGTNISMAPYLAQDPTEKLELIRDIKREVAPLTFQPPDLEPVKLNELSRVIYSTQGYMGAAADAVEWDEKHQTDMTRPPKTGDTNIVLASPSEIHSGGLQTNATTMPANSAVAASIDETNLVSQLMLLRDTLDNMRKQMLSMDQEVASQKLAAFQQALFNDVGDTFQSIKGQDDSSGLRAEDLPLPLQHRFIGRTGKYLIQVYPKGDAWNHEVQKEFAKEVRSVDPSVTGTPIQLFEYTKLLKDSYVQAAYYALAVIAVMVLYHFRSLSFLMLSLIPVGIGTIWMCGWMGLCNIPFNPANIMVLPLVIGIGVTNGIHILNRFVEEKNANILSKSTGKAVFVSGLTTISGFGSLMLGKHLGIRSLGEVMAMGVALCMAAALMLLPAVLNLWGARLVKKQPSGDNAQSTLGREEPR